jgi:hypothetical protein
MRSSRVAPDQDEIDDGDPMVRIDVSGERRECAVGMRMLTVGVCSNESGIEGSRTFIKSLLR